MTMVVLLLLAWIAFSAGFLAGHVCGRAHERAFREWHRPLEPHEVLAQLRDRP